MAVPLPGLPENIYPDDAPLLVRIELEDAQQVQWLYALAREAVATAPLLVLGSSWRFEVLAEWLIRCIDAQHEGRAGIFRFWDTRIFSYLLPMFLVMNSKVSSTDRHYSGAGWIATKHLFCWKAMGRH